MSTSATPSHKFAVTDAQILAPLAQRWSPRAFDAEARIPDEKLTTALEAARWAPSAFNAQPWQFLLARRGTERFDRVLRHLIEFNQSWAQHADTLIVNVAEVVSEKGSPNATAIYDLGQAVAFFTVQAQSQGLHVHQMSGIDNDALHDEFDLGERFAVVSVMAVGVIGDPGMLSDQLRERELALRERKPLADLLVASE